MSLPKTIRGITVALALLVVAGACQSGGTGGAPQAGSTGKKVLTIVIGRAPDEPLGLLNRLGGSKPYTDLAADVLMERDPADGSLKPQLAEKWEMIAPNKWRFTLRKGVKFHDGEDFNAETAKWSIEKQTEADSPARVVRYAKELKAEAVDPYTLDIICPTACPILDIIAPQLQFVPPKWAQANPKEAAQKPVGTGPFKLEEWRTGEFMRFVAFKDYWGDTGYFDEVKFVWRSEPGVRASMVAAGEAQLSDDLDLESIDIVPKTFKPESIDYAWIRLRERDANGKLDPLWGDKRFRQALAYAIDCDAMAETLLKGAVKCSPFPFNSASVGFIKDGPRHEYNPEKARQLLDEVVGAGKEVNGVKMFSETGDIPRVWAETIMSYWEDIGVHATFEFVDGPRREKLHNPGVKGNPPDVFIQKSHTNDLFDATVSLAYIDGCNEPRSYSVCNEEFSQKLKDAGAASGEERRGLLEALERDYFYDGAYQIPLWSSPAIYGAAANLEWEGPVVGWLRPDRMKFS
ncbi:ABC transporter substrate-binding protein [Tenggerimyces flavus]|uniref:ABC transporter substrate-binding protein n=1 Tax=Tenggerimyces flavus TaxID=1708749 RepID=A0ABV7YC33_9ACTN|nr:ABC transporter substrate-binding protein [Tenggerimyces flavus]MBM7789785.1 peptide/nickel transport system substrate-binding protein [Tenggerimyces flavus]